MTEAQTIGWIAFVIVAALLGFALGRLSERDRAEPEGRP